MSAILDVTRTYRYRLRRVTTSPAGPPVLWVMLNPSTADEYDDDPTIRKCRGFQGNWHEIAGATWVVNLFALRATDPRELREHPDPVGPENDAYIRSAMLDVIKTDGLIVVAWGAHKMARRRAAAVLDWLPDVQRKHRVKCLGTTKDGSPRHPLYVPYSRPLVPWRGYPVSIPRPGGPEPGDTNPDNPLEGQ